MEFLKLTTDYAIRPAHRAFTLLGSEHHSHLEELSVSSQEAPEARIRDEGLSGKPDLVEVENGQVTLWDYKTWGSYRVARYLGMTAETIDDPSGAVYLKSGTWGRAGQPKQVKVWSPNPLVGDTTEPTLQLNGYRLLLQPLTEVHRMRLQVTVRDGGLKVARERGIGELIYVFEVDRLPDTDVRDWFEDRRMGLQLCVEGNQVPPICSPTERWDDTRCREYCEVAFACDYGRQVMEIRKEEM